MQVIDVIPLIFIPRNQTQILSYFGNEPLVVGSVVEVPYNHRTILGVVVGSEPIKNRKLDFKKEVNFELKKITKILDPEARVSNTQLKIAKYISDYYYAPLGVCLKTILPPFFGKKKFTLLPIVPPVATVTKQDFSLKYIRAKLQNHYLDCEKEIKEKLKSGKQVLLLVAENTAGKYFLEQYKKFDPVFLSSATKQKDYFEIWEKISANKTKLVISTRVGLFLPFSNLGSVILDDESNEFYKSDMSPRYNTVSLAQFVANINGADLILSSVMPRVETWYQIDPIEQKKITSASGKQNTEVIDMVREIKLGNFSIFSRKLKEKIFHLKDRLILYVPRRGSANLISCQKCGNSINCPNCTVSLVVHKMEVPANSKPTIPKHNLVCHHCAHKQELPQSCPTCGSYKLKGIGIGAEKVFDTIEGIRKLNALDFKIFNLSSDESQNNDEKESKIIKEFNETKSAILITSQIIFSHKNLIKAPFIGIISGDSLTVFPDFRSEESTMRQFITLSEMADELLIQTHNPENGIIKMATRGDLGDFFKEELENRKTFSYPPFSGLIKLTFKYRDLAKCRNEARILYQKLKQQLQNTGNNSDLEILEPGPAFIAKERGLHVWNIIIKSKADQIKIRNELLRIVPPGWIIDIDPKNII